MKIRPSVLRWSVVWTISTGMTLTAEGTDGLEGLSWLAGCWAYDDAAPGSGEQWMAPAGGTLFGISRTIRDGRTVAHEFMQIRLGSDAIAEFVAQPSGQAQTVFTMHRQDASEAVFDHPLHDFPQTVAYRRVSNDRIVGSIEGVSDGERRRIELPMSRVPCGESW
jgi:hypothetical protein